MVHEIIPGVGSDTIAGCEIGTQIAYPEGTDLVNLHFDCNMHLLARTGTPQSAVWSGIFHLGPRGGIVGGETAVCLEDPPPPPILERAFRSSPMEQVLSCSDHWIRVPQRCNRLLVFAGSLAHFRTPLRRLPSPDAPRVSVVAALYATRTVPGDRPCLLPPEAVRILYRLPLALQLAIGRIAAALGPGKLASLAPSVEAADALSPALAASWKEIVSRLPETDLAVLVGALDAAFQKEAA
jgi:hypothetical protein